MEELIGKELGSYQVVSLLGKGAMADVYKAYQANMDRHVALKVLSRGYTRHTTFLDRFLQEAQIIVKLEHPHIVPVYDFGQVGDYFYIAMRLVKGGTLGDRFHGQPFSLGEMRKIVNQIGDALDYAHSEGVVHRDVKPKNILMDRRDNALLTDFGIAKDLESDAKITQFGRTVGTPTYMSPEQIQGEPLDGRSDIYSLGVVLYQLATGHLPFQADTPEEICLQHLRDPVPSPRAQNPDLPEALEQVITAMLAKQPADRQATAGEVVRAVEDATLPKTPPSGDEAASDPPSNDRANKEDEATQISPAVDTAPTGLMVENNLPTPPPSIERTAQSPQIDKSEGATLHVPSIKIALPPLPDEDSGATLSIPSSQATKISPRQKGGWNVKVLAIIGGAIVLLMIGILMLGSAGLLVFFASGPPPGDFPAPPSPPGQLLLDDDFSDKRLEESTDEYSQVGYQNGQYVITVNQNETTSGASVGDVYDDFIIEIEATQLDGSLQDGYGFLLREQENQFYVFEVKGEGVFEFYKVIDDKSDVLLIRQHPVIQPNDSNTLRVVAIGSDFFFFINNAPVGHALGPDIKQGAISLMVDAEDPGARVAFDNLKIWAIAD